MMLFILTCISAIISTSLSCLVSIDDIYLSNPTGDTIIIVAKNSNNSDNIFSYPGWKIYINNVIFGQEEISYFGINNYAIDFTVTSNTTTVTLGERVSLYLELWINHYSKRECTFDSIGTINTENISNMTTAVQYPYRVCPATLEKVYTDDSTGKSMTIEISNDPGNNNPNNDIFSYPSIMVYTVNNNNFKDYFGKSGDLYYGIGSYNQSFLVESNNITNPTITVDQPINLYIELYIQLPVDIKACTFEWTRTVGVITTEPTEVPTEIPTAQPTEVTQQPTEQPTTEIPTAQPTEQPIEPITTDDTFDPSGGVKQYVWQVFACMVGIFMIMQ